MDAQQGPTFPNQYSHPADYLQPEPDPDGIETFVAPTSAHPSAYTTGGALDTHRRDGNAAPSSYSLASIRNPHAARYGVDSGLAPDGSYRAGNDFSDPNSSSIAEIPSLSSSHYTYNTIHTGPVHQFTTLPTPSNSVLQPPVPGYHTAYRDTSGIEHTAPGNLHLPHPHHLRSSVSSPVYPDSREPFTHTALVSRSQYPSFPTYDTPRTSVPSTGHLYSGQPYVNQMNSPRQSHNSLEDCSNFRWPKLECTADVTCNGQTVVPDVQAHVEKGFFQDKAEGKWTCYRRNYFSVGCSYTLAPNIDGGQIYVKRNGSQEKVKAIAIRISAAVDGQNGKAIELIQHTPKRDAGPKMKVMPVRMLPKPSNTTTQQIHQPLAYGHAHIVPFHQIGQVPAPTLSLQFVIDPQPVTEPGTQTAQASNATAYTVAQPQQTNPGQETTHTFERIQFKCATANNGKRRASQQYFHLIAELLVDLRKHDTDEPAWHTIAKRTSGNIVVRGRSPSHYQMEGGNTGNGRGNAGAGRRYSSVAAGGMPNAMGYGTLGQAQMRSPGMGASTTAGAAMGYPAMNYGSNLSFRPHSSYAPHESSGDSASSPDSVNADAFDAEHHPTGGMLSQSDRSPIHEVDGYSYHPSPIYDPVPYLPRPRGGEGPLRGTTDPRQHAFRHEFPDGNPGSQYHFNGRFQGFNTSRNVFPDISGGAGSYS